MALLLAVSSLNGPLADALALSFIPVQQVLRGTAAVTGLKAPQTGEIGNDERTKEVNDVTRSVPLSGISPGHFLQVSQRKEGRPVFHPRDTVVSTHFLGLPQACFFRGIFAVFYTVFLEIRSYQPPTKSKHQEFG